MTITETKQIDSKNIKQNYIIDKKTGHILFEGDWYFPIKYRSRRRPLVTGAPKISYQKYYWYIGKQKLQNKKVVGLFKTPNECSFYQVLNHNIYEHGGLQFAFIGQFGFAKSTLLATVETNLLARYHRIIQFDDMDMECQKIAPHGYFTNHGKTFHPFKIIIWIPAGYSFDTDAENFKPMKRNNVKIKEFTTAREIVDSMKPHILISVFKEAFDNASFLRLLMDIIYEISRKTTRNKSYILATHEFGNLFPEGASGDEYRAIRDIALKEIRKLRGRNIGILTSFHRPYDVAYFIGQKFNMVGQVRPAIIGSKTMSRLEYIARNYKRGDVAIAAGMHYRKHHIDELPTDPIIYYYNPNPIPFYYSTDYGPIDQITLLANLELKRIEDEERKIAEKELSEKKKNEQKLLDYDLKKKHIQEQILNKEYILEKEIQFKKELEEFKTEQKIKLLEKEKEVQNSKIQKKSCLNCGKAFYGKEGRKYCSENCNKQAYWKRKSVKNDS